MAARRAAALAEGTMFLETAMQAPVHPYVSKHAVSWACRSGQGR